MTPELADGLGLPQDWGVILADVYPAGPAATAGLRVGDIVLTLDGKPMENARQFEVNLYPRGVGETWRCSAATSALCTRSRRSSVRAIPTASSRWRGRRSISCLGWGSSG